MARLVKYSPRDENRYSTFLDTQSLATQYTRTAESDDSFVSFNQFKLCDTDKIVKNRNKNSKNNNNKRRRWIKEKLNIYFCCDRYSICACCCGKKRNDNDEVYDINLKIANIKRMRNQDDENNDDFDDGCINGGRYNAGGTLKTEMGTPGRRPNKWTWNESLRSNSDKFLETLEYDDLLIIDRSLKRMKKIAKIRPIAYRPMGGSQNEYSGNDISMS